MGKERIAIVGSYGCGKTVLLSVLAHHYRIASEGGLQIIPDNQEAVNFCTKNWALLKNGKWPPPTPPTDNPPIYKWKLLYGKKEKDIVTSDIAGEAWHSIIIKYTEDSEKNVFWEAIKQKWNSIPVYLSQIGLSNHVVTVEDMLNTATRVYFLLDLAQIMDKEEGYEEAIYLPLAIERYMKSIGRKKVPITLVLTKTDKYEFLYEETHDWRIAFQKFKERNDVPWIPDFDRIIPVSAVSKTKCNNPAQNFTSEGLDALCWSFWESKQGFMSGVIKRVFRLNASEQHNRLPK